ncbi:hypothetical protein CBR_g9113 [Chara braunii]|uniref:RING-type domain-containing protein n=1 Tax=Chara braunii TaxID=69332 RepID=A0A388KNS3_CHABU|nr:hypothetical protein CBR_g9113 [Chara braunii]|eukprot:GBG71701.1 hypothetical protein CBR_g9113 [Chara braunii]
MTSTAAAADVPIPPGLTCPICMDVFRDPVLVPCCSNTFCRTCLDQALARNDACPICRAPILAVGDPVLPNRAVAALVQAAESAIILMPEEGEGGGQWLQSPSIGVGGVRSGSGSSAVAGGRQLLLGGGSVSIGGASSSPSSPSAARSSIEGHVAGSPSSIVMMTRGTLDSSSPSSIVMMTRGSLDSSSSSELPASGPVLWWPSRHSRSSAGGGVLWGIGGGGGREGGGGRGGAEMDVHRIHSGIVLTVVRSDVPASSSSLLCDEDLEPAIVISAVIRRCQEPSHGRQESPPHRHRCDQEEIGAPTRQAPPHSHRMVVRSRRRIVIAVIRRSARPLHDDSSCIRIAVIRGSSPIIVSVIAVIRRRSSRIHVSSRCILIAVITGSSPIVVGIRCILIAVIWGSGRKHCSQVPRHPQRCDQDIERSSRIVVRSRRIVVRSRHTVVRSRRTPHCRKEPSPLRHRCDQEIETTEHRRPLPIVLYRQATGMRNLAVVMLDSEWEDSWI